MSGAADGMDCAGTAMLLHALADGELDAAHVLRCEAHLRGCARCATALAELRATRAALQGAGLRYRAPEALRGRILALVEAETPAAARPAWLRRPLAVLRQAVAWRWRPGAGMPAIAFAAGMAVMVLVVAPLRPEGGDAALRREVVAGHVRSLLVAGRLTDVPSSDRHTVKPWFAGRIAFSPPTPDLAEVGFPLAGGQLDYLDERAVAALVHRRRDHVINLFVWPDPAAARPEAPRVAGTGGGREDGHSVVQWRQGGMVFWAVSDLNAAELLDFAGLFGARAQDAAPAS